MRLLAPLWFVQTLAGEQCSPLRLNLWSVKLISPPLWGGCPVRGGRGFFMCRRDLFRLAYARHLPQRGRLTSLYEFQRDDVGIVPYGTPESVRFSKRQNAPLPQMRQRGARLFYSAGIRASYRKKNHAAAVITPRNSALSRRNSHPYRLVSPGQSRRNSLKVIRLASEAIGVPVPPILTPSNSSR